MTGVCFAVGSYADGTGKLKTLVERWNGSTWSVQSPPNPGKGGLLSGVSCLSATSCTAVGFSVSSSNRRQPLAERWNGSDWSVQTTPLHTGTVDSDLGAVSCASATACTAVGSYTNSADKTLTLAERWNGSGWSVQTSRNPLGAADTRLTGVSCSAGSACTAVGESTDGSGTQAALAERWNGTSWSIQAVRKPPTAGSALGSVSCPSASACTAVGNVITGAGTPLTLAERWNGTSWSIQGTPNPAGLSSLLTGVDCASASACTSTGFSFSDNAGKFLAERWNGTSWSVQTVPTPAGGLVINGGLNGISCASTAMCMTVGGYLNSAIVGVTAAELWVSGSGWGVQSPVNPVGARNSYLNAVTCSSATACTAVGGFTKDVGPPETLAYRWNGTSWSIQYPANPSGVNSELTAVSCTSATMCLAVGFSFAPSVTKTLAERWNGSTWSVLSTPNPSADSRLTAVSCTSATSCTAVGQTVSSGGDQGTLAERWNGSTWSLQATHDPAGTTASEFGGVSCTSATDCLAVGDYTANAGMQVLAERWNGSTWYSQATPDPAGDNRLLAVSCTTATACTAVGDSTDTDQDTEVTLAERWDGSSWSVQPTADPADHTSLVAVSCPTTTACTAVGSSGGSDQTLAESWDGSSWSALPTVNPGTSPILGGVFCQLATACVAVGQDRNTGARVPLAERYA